jgi:hypothetical protein
VAKTVHNIFGESLVGLITIMIISVFLFVRAGKEKSAFNKLSGKITSLEKTNAKKRLLQVEDHTFELFIGKDVGDFKPKFERIDKLKPGDYITIYFDDQGDPINNLAYFIDKGDEPFFIKGSWEKGMSYFLAGLCVTIFILLYTLKRLGKIV